MTGARIEIKRGARGRVEGNEQMTGNWQQHHRHEPWVALMGRLGGMARTMARANGYGWSPSMPSCVTREER
jgi:hypothetical protein